MAIVVLRGKPTKVEIEKMTEEFGDYIKLVVDLERETIAGGCQLHVDCEKALLEEGSQQQDLWGGGIDLGSGEIDTLALINIRPPENPGQEIFDKAKREKFANIVKTIFSGES